MSRKSKRTKIPKNRDIEEVVEKEEGKIKIETMEEVIKQMEKREEFINRIKYENMQKNKRLQNVYSRKDAQLAVQKRKEEYLKAISRIQEQEER